VSADAPTLELLADEQLLAAHRLELPAYVDLRAAPRLSDQPPVTSPVPRHTASAP